MSNFGVQTRRLLARKASEQVTCVITSVRRLTLKTDCFYRQTKNLPHCRFQCTTCQRGFDLKTRCQVQTKAARHSYHALTNKQSHGHNSDFLCFPVSRAGYRHMCPRAWYRLNVFPRFELVTCFPALGTVYIFRACQRLTLSHL